MILSPLSCAFFTARNEACRPTAMGDIKSGKITRFLSGNTGSVGMRLSKLCGHDGYMGSPVLEFKSNLVFCHLATRLKRDRAEMLMPQSNFAQRRLLRALVLARQETGG